MTIMSAHRPVSSPADRGGDLRALRGGLELGHRLALWRQPCRKEPLVPVAGDDAPAIARQLSARSWPPGLRLRPTVAVKNPGVTHRICALGSWPRHQAGKAIEARCDFRWRGGRLTTSRRICPRCTAAHSSSPDPSHRSRDAERMDADWRLPAHSRPEPGTGI